VGFGVRGVAGATPSNARQRRDSYNERIVMPSDLTIEQPAVEAGSAGVDAAPAAASVRLGDYSLVGKDTALAIEKGLAEATWYASPVAKLQMRELLLRRDWPAIRDTAIWFALLFLMGIWGYHAWGTWWTVIPFGIYGVIYASTSDSRWHESSHGTAFKTDWMNNALYEVASFMVLRESVPWRWSHARHHSDTIIVGRDPEIAVPRPPSLRAMFLNFFNLRTFPRYVRNVTLHCFGKLNPAEATFIPPAEQPKVFFRARVYVLIYAAVSALAVYHHSFLPLMYIGLPNLYGAWMMPVYGLTQHAGLAENVLDHRLNCRTVCMNPINRFFYWNMNYHLEHHMFPLVPYHALPRLHVLVKEDTPPPYRGLVDAWSEIIPTVLRQRKDPAFHVKRAIPTPTDRSLAPQTAEAITAGATTAVDGWIEVCAAGNLGKEDVVRFDHAGRTYAIYRTSDGNVYATDGICTHGNAHLADGMVKGRLIECPKHNGRFDVTDGSPKRKPACVALQTFPVRVTDGKLFLKLGTPNSAAAATQKTYRFRVVSNDNVATFIKELVLDPLDAESVVIYQPGDYLQLDIPAYGEISFREITVRLPFADVWEAQHVFDFRSSSAVPVRRNYSLASNPAVDKQLRFNVRIATPPRGQACNAGTGSAYMHRLKPGDVVSAIGPFGEFHIKPTDKEMIYVGGGSGMAPLRSHISYLLETLGSARRISFWYGARSLQEVYYREYFENLAARFPNFSYHLVLSEPQPEDHWNSYTGFIHEVVRREYLDGHRNPGDAEFYLCGPPVRIQGMLRSLRELDVPKSQIAFDEF
jgi:Na+-transporting NADH:ubiquinone oxidoreductase subunit F